MPDPRLIRFPSVDDLAQRWAVSPRTIRRLVENGHLRGVRIGKLLRFDPAVVERFELRRGTDQPRVRSGH